MKAGKYLITVILISILFSNVKLDAADAKSEQAVWGELAAQQTKEEFPDYRLVDFSYKGKYFISNIREQFHYTMAIEKENEQEHINVYVLSNPQTGEPVDVFFDKIR